MLYTLFIMDKDLSLIRLFGIYGMLLTEHQRDLFNLYYECDLSLGEIAEIKGISRQSVNDGLKKAREFLVETENKLMLSNKMDKLLVLVTEAENGDDVAQEFAQKIRSILEDS